MTEERQFAYGSNTHGECPCPAVATGRNPDVDHRVCEVAERFDDEIRGEAGFENDGVVDEETAREAWGRVINMFHESMRKAIGEEERGYYEERFIMACIIAEELGWDSIL